MMNGSEESDPAIVARKPANKAEQSAAELVERRAGAEGNAGRQSTRRAQNRVSVTQALDRVREVLPSNTQGGSRMREFRSYGSVRGCALKAHGIQSPEMATPVKLSSQPGTESCVVIGNERHEA
jgi:hypothetical protein